MSQSGDTVSGQGAADAPDAQRAEGTALPGGDERFQPGGIDAAASQAYSQVVADPPPAESAGERAGRLRRRRRILMTGAVPVLLVTVAAVWLAAVWLAAFAGSRAVADKDYEVALDRYELVGTLNPWIDQWRVHYNIGTAALLGGHGDQARSRLEQALAVVPRGKMVQGQAPDGSTVTVRDPKSAECQVRTNLYAAYYAAYADATQAGDSRKASSMEAKMTEAKGDCQITEPEASSTPSPSQSGSASPSPTPGSSSSPTATPSPEASGSASPTPTPGASGSATPSPSPGASGSPSPSPSPSPGDDKHDDLEDRNASANPSDDGGLRGGRRW